MSLPPCVGERGSCARYLLFRDSYASFSALSTSPTKSRDSARGTSEIEVDPALMAPWVEAAREDEE